MKAKPFFSELIDKLGKYEIKIYCYYCCSKLTQLWKIIALLNILAFVFIQGTSVGNWLLRVIMLWVLWWLGITWVGHIGLWDGYIYDLRSGIRVIGVIVAAALVLLLTLLHHRHHQLHIHHILTLHLHEWSNSLILLLLSRSQIPLIF